MKYTFASGDDWTGLYVDNDLAFEGHSLAPEQIARHAMDYPVTEVEVKEVDYDWLDDEGYLPKTLDEVKWYDT